MMILFDICNNHNFLTLFLILKIVFRIICIIIPLIIMYRWFIPLFKAVTSGKSFQDDLSPAFKSLLAGLIVFLLPSLFNFVFVDLIGESNGLGACFTNATTEKITELRQLDEQNQKDENDKRKEDLNDAAVDREEKEDKEDEAIKENIAEREEEENVSSADSPSTGPGVLNSAAKNIIIGDSRTVGMCASITGDWSKCQFSVSGGFATGDDIYIAQGSMGYSWFNSSAVTAVNRILTANPNTTYNIFSLMGVNFLLSDVDKYIPMYNSLAKGAWKKHNLILVSVNPVDERIEAQNGYSTKNADIITFNKKIKNGTSGVSNIKYCDTFNLIKNNLVTGDGLHYGSSTYKAIYSGMKSCVS